MQSFKITHRTYYNYPQPVTLGEQILLLRPREDHSLRIQSFELNIEPKATVRWHKDVQNNSVGIATFHTQTQQLLIESQSIVQQYNQSPLNFLVSDYAQGYPFTYLPHDYFMLAPYLTLPPMDVINVLNKWISQFWQVGQSIQTYQLLEKMAECIFKNMHYNIREEPGVQTAKYTIKEQSGSCRDFAYLFMLSARCLGFAARFVSGYLYAPLMSDQVGSTHAWSEVYVPGAGWIGFDPTIGKIVGSDHIAVAVADLPESIPPIGGSFSGAKESTMSVGVWVSQV
ncbi:transglutaminase family protein [Marinicellulosiphila megalodicopiae]|uniref:transglutaminase family protein n=1 Tax=Marinicellulosiphila megalodicopiae TaxID=2724896 RepID=UPI003BAF0B0E